MTTTAEVEREFRRYFMTGPVLEDWQAWADLFTDDATYFDHFYGTFTGPAEITKFLEGTMGAAPQVYSPLVWYVVDGTRVAYKVLNRADNPQPGGQPIDFPSYQFIEYAGDGKWRSEEDVWLLPEMKQFAKRYAAAADAHPQTLNRSSAAMIGARGWTGRARNPDTTQPRHGWTRPASRRSPVFRTSTSGSGPTDAC